MVRDLPITIRSLEGEAKDILRAQKTGDSSVCGIYRLLDRFRNATDEDILQSRISLQATQSALALDYGIEEWEELKARVKSIVDLRREEKEIREYVKKRILHYTGNSTDPVYAIMVGFFLGLDAWMTVFFDTCERPESDREWPTYIKEESWLRRPRWSRVFEQSQDQKVTVINIDGTQSEFGDDSPEQKFAVSLGAMLKHMLLSAWIDGLFDDVPMDDRCELTIEKLDGFYADPVLQDGHGLSARFITIEPVRCESYSLNNSLWNALMEDNYLIFGSPPHDKRSDR